MLIHMHLYDRDMSVMEKRLQLLLDAHRYELVSAEARRTGRSVASVIREAIDLRFAEEEARARRAAALGEFLDLIDEDPGPAANWREIKAELEDDLASHIDHTLGMNS